MQGNAAAVRFSTDDLPPHERVPRWRELVFRTAAKVDIELESGAPFRASATIRQLPGLRILEGVSPPALYQRAPGAVDDDGVTFQFGIGVSGWTQASLSGREADIHSGEAFALPSASRAEIRVRQETRFVSLRLPRAAVAGSVVNLDGTYCRTISGGTPALSLLKRYVRMIEAASGALATPELQHAAVTHIYDLIALTLGATRDATELANGRGVREARLKSMKDDVVRRVKDQSLSVQSVAQRHNVTPRYVQKLFEESGETFTEFVVAQRLVRANRLLCDPQLADRTLTAIAFESGFGDLSYFNRAFRRRFGGSPAEIRAKVAASG
jgi:AraC-like DNA-binding protein